MRLPPQALARHVGAVLLTGQCGFFEAEAAGMREVPHRAVVARSPRSASSATRPRNVKGADAVRARNQSGWAPLNLCQHCADPAGGRTRLRPHSLLSALFVARTLRRPKPLRPLYTDQKRHAQCLGHVTHRPARIKPCQRPVPDVHAKRFCHGSRPKHPNSTLSQKLNPTGIPRFTQTSSRSSGFAESPCPTPDRFPTGHGPCPPAQAERSRRGGWSICGR